MGAKQAADIVAPVLQQALISAGQATLAAGEQLGKEAVAAGGPVLDQLTAQANAQLTANTAEISKAVPKENIDQVVNTLGGAADAAKPLLEKGIKEATPYAESAGKEVAQVAGKVAATACGTCSPSSTTSSTTERRRVHALECERV